MRTFEAMNKSNGDKCPICKTQDDGEVVLIGIAGTEDDGICVAEQFHLKCIDLTYDQNRHILYQRIK